MKHPPHRVDPVDASEPDGLEDVPRGTLETQTVTSPKVMAAPWLVKSPPESTADWK